MSTTRRKRWDPTPDQIQQLKTMGGLRLPYRHMAAIFGVSESTLEVALKKNVAARKAIEEGMATASVNVRQTAYAQATGLEEIRDPQGKVIQEARPANPTMLIFWLKTQEGFRETERVELVDTEGKLLDMTPEERRKEIARLRKLREELGE